MEAKERRHLETRLAEARERYAGVVRRLAAVESALTTPGQGDSERIQVLEERKSGLIQEQRQIGDDLAQIDAQLASSGLSDETVAVSLMRQRELRERESTIGARIAALDRDIAQAADMQPGTVTLNRRWSELAAEARELTEEIGRLEARLGGDA